MEVSYTTTADDFAAGTLWAIRKTQHFRTRYFVSWLFIPVLSLLAAGLIVARRDQFVVPAIVAAIGLLYFLVFPRLFWGRIRTAALESARQVAPGLLGPTRLLLTDELVSIVTEAGRADAKWSDLEGVEETDDRVFLSLGGLLPVVIPRAGFPRAADYEAMRDYLTARLGRAA
jgi:hypothetical protein